MLTTHRRRTAAVSLLAAGGLALAGCGGSDDAAGGGGGGGDTVAVSLITKTATNPFFVSMTEGAQQAAEEAGVELTTAAGREDGDEATQITAIENAISAGQQGILITPNGPGVNNAIEQAREAGLFVIALDTPPEPADVVDITFATDNFRAGELIGEWTAAQLAGQPATIAMIDAFDDQIVSSDWNRDQGFLTGMGIDTADPTVVADEAPTGQYSGGEYTIVCNEASQAAEDGGRTAMENCLSQNPDINVVYTINEPAGVGANIALEAAGVTDAIVVSVDGGCPGVQDVADGNFGATAQQYPLDMAALGVQAIADLVNDGTEPETTPGLDFFDTGVALVTDTPVEGLESIDTAEGLELCWGE